MERDEPRCARCQGVLRHRPEQPADWLATENDDDPLAGLVCPNCWTPEERQLVEKQRT